MSEFLQKWLEIDKYAENLSTEKIATNFHNKDGQDNLPITNDNVGLVYLPNSP